MALPLGHWIRLQVGGAMVNDTWSTGIWFSGLAEATPTAAQISQWALNALTDFNTLVWSPATNSLKSANASYCTLATARAFFYIDNNIQQSGTAAITAVPGTGSSPHPPYAALVATTLTGLAGRRNRGRMYLPVTGLAVSSSTGQQNGSPAAFANNLAAWINDRGTWATGPGWPVNAVSPVVMTQTGSAPQVITALRMDSRFDTQRNRENKLVPAVTSSAAVT